MDVLEQPHSSQVETLTAQLNKITPAPVPAPDVTKQLLDAFLDFASLQRTFNQGLLNKLQALEAHVERVRIENMCQLQQLHHTQQTLNLVSKRIPRAQNRRIRCVFIVSFLHAWNTLADIYDVMRASDDFEPIIVSTARKRAKDTGIIYGEELTHQFLESEGLPHIRLDTAVKDNNCMDILKALAPDIIFRQSPWHDLPPVFNPAEINFARLCYVPYSFSAVRRLDKDEPADITSSARHTDLYYHRLCWRIFCETELHKNMYVDTSIRAGENVVVTGYPKFDRLLAAKQRPPFWPIVDEQAGRRRFRIIWAPHHSVTRDVMGFGTFIEVHKELFAWAKESAHEYEFVLRPHPALVSEIVHTLKAFSQEYMDSFFAAWNALPNTALDESGNYGPLFVASDVMLTDGVGFLSEYQIFAKPLIFLDSGHHFGFNAVGNIMMESANKVKTVAEVRALCARLKNGEPDPMREIQETVIPRIMPYPGKSAQQIVQAIRDGLAAEGI